MVDNMLLDHSDGHMSTEQMESFSDEWLDAWNEHELENILVHYSADVRFYSPGIAKLTNTDNPYLVGRKALREYWLKAFEMFPDLHFELSGKYYGARAMSLNYKNQLGQAVIESFVFGPNGLVVLSIASYARM